MADIFSDQLFVGETLIGSSPLIEPGSISIMLDDETIHVVPAAELRKRCESFGPSRVTAFLLAPIEFDKLKIVVNRRAERAAA